MNIYNLQYEKNKYINLRDKIKNICNDIESTYDNYDRLSLNMKKSFSIDEESADFNNIIKNKNEIASIRGYLNNVILNEINAKIIRINRDIENYQQQM